MTARAPLTLATIILSLSAIPAPVAAQSASGTPPTDEDPDIIVTGQVQRGTVIGDIKPELQLGPADVRALGVSSVTELLAELAPQLASGRGSGPPVVLLEGRRISGFREIATLPAEAIARVDILPEEVALKYGYPANQKVVNIVLRQRFKAFTLEGAGRIATGGGATNADGEFDYLRIQRNGRFNINAEYDATAKLLETQRGVVSGTGQEAYRTLLPSQREFKLNSTLNRIIAGDVSATLNGELTINTSDSLFGLPGTTLTLPDGSTTARAFDTLRPLTRSNETRTGYVATTLNGAEGTWRWTFTGNYTRIDSQTFIDRGIDPTLLQAALLAGDPAASLALPIAPQFAVGRPADTARSASDVGIIDFTISGSPVRLPAGDVSVTVKSGAEFSSFDASALRSGVVSQSHVTRDIANVQGNVDLPIASRREAVLPFLGDLSLNGNAAVQRLSDYGTLTTYGFGASWSPIEPLRLLGSFTEDENAPSPQQIGNPLIANPNVQIFDFVRGQNAIVTQISGGNPALLQSTVRTWKLGATLKPLAKTDLTLTADYVRTKTGNGIAALPPASLAAQLAFPDRYIRDAAGTLIRVDARPVNFAQAEQSQLRWGINFSKPLKTSQAQINALQTLFRQRFPNGGPGGAGRPGAGGQRGSGGGGGGFGGGGGGFGGGGGRLQFALYHTWHFTDRVTLRDGSAPIDLLDGGVIGSGGGQPRHEVEVQAGYARNGLGARLTGNWQSATQVTGASGLAADRLNFSDLATFNLRLFANATAFPKLLKSAPWLAGMRVTIGVNNLFDTRQRVTDGTGATPFAYQPGYIDPLGRTIRISIRKLLF